MAVLFKRFCDPLFNRPCLFVERASNQHNLLPSRLVLSYIIILFDLIDCVFRSSAAAQLKLKNVYSISRSNDAIRTSGRIVKTIRPCIVLTASFDFVETSLLRGTTAIHGGTAIAVDFRLHELPHQFKNQIYGSLIVLFPQFQVFFAEIIIRNTRNNRLHPFHNVCKPSSSSSTFPSKSGIK